MGKLGDGDAGRLPKNSDIGVVDTGRGKGVGSTVKSHSFCGPVEYFSPNIIMQ